MNILYVSRACPQKKYDELKNKPSQASTKFNRLIVEGLSYNGANVHCAFVDEKNISVNWNKQIIKYIDNNVIYYIKRNIKNKFLKKIFNFFNIINVFHNVLREKNSILICDYLCITNSLLALVVAKFKNRKSVAIVTDLPEFIGDSNNKNKYTFKKRFYVIISNFLLKRFDYYVLLTEEMKYKINKNIKNNEYIVMEGLIDINSTNIINNLENKDSIKKCIYAGSLHKEYGIDLLIKAFHKVNLQNSVLHIYGDGNYINEIKEICKLDNRIKYLGKVSNDKIIKEQITATLLINPRTSQGEYTKYSFPSKNMEYMSSGTPILGCVLPGMPKEYIEYMYIIREENNLVYLTNKLEEILSTDKVKLHNMGKKAKEFVLKEKNNVIQTKRIINLLNK
mgnify:CR=1 FL=1